MDKYIAKEPRLQNSRIPDHVKRVTVNKVAKALATRYDLNWTELQGLYKTHPGKTLEGLL